MYLGVNQLISLPSVASLEDNYLSPKDISNQTIKGEEEYHDAETSQASPLTLCTKF